MGRRIQNTILDSKLTKRCYVLLHRLPQSQLPVLEDKKKRKTSNHFQSTSKRGITPNASKSHKQEDITTNEAGIRTHVCRKTRLSKQRLKERMDFVASDHTQEPIPKMERDSTESLSCHLEKEETKSVNIEDGTTPVKPGSSKSFFRLGFDVYVKEFKNYIYALRERNRTNKDLCHFDSSETDSDEELMNLNEKCDYEVNKRLVESIIKNSLNLEVSLEGQWATIKDAIVEAEKGVLMEQKKSGKRMAERSYDRPEQKIQKSSQKKNSQINSDGVNRNLSKTSPKIRLLEKNEVTVKMMDVDQSTSERETAPSNDLQSTVIMSKNDSATRNSELKPDETPLSADYEGAANLSPTEDPESNGFADNTERLDKIQKPSNIVLKASDQQESLGTNQTTEKLLEYDHSRERSNESSYDTNLKNCEQQERLFAKQENGSVGSAVAELSNNSSDKLNAENNTHASKVGVSKSDNTKPDRVTVEDSIDKITSDETCVTENDASCHSATLSPLADMLLDQDTVERRDSSLQNAIPAEENTSFVNRPPNYEMLHSINEIIDDVVSKIKEQIRLNPPSEFPCSTSDNAKGNEDSSSVQFFSPVSKKNCPSVDSPINAEEAVKLIVKRIENSPFWKKKQEYCDSCSATAFSSSISGGKSNPDNAKKRSCTTASTSDNMPEDSLKTASVESAANNFTSLNVLHKDNMTYDKFRKFVEDSRSCITKETENMLNSRHCKNSIKYEILKCFFVLRSEHHRRQKELKQNNEKKDNEFKIAPETGMKDLAEKSKDDTEKTQGKKWP